MYPRLPLKAICAREGERVILVDRGLPGVEIVVYESHDPPWFRCLIYTDEVTQLDIGPCRMGWEGEDPTSWRAAREMAMKQAGLS
jgi:hypothetical protein